MRWRLDVAEKELGCHKNTAATILARDAGSGGGSGCFVLHSAFRQPSQISKKGLRAAARTFLVSSPRAGAIPRRSCQPAILSTHMVEWSLSTHMVEWSSLDFQLNGQYMVIVKQQTRRLDGIRRMKRMTSRSNPGLGNPDVLRRVGTRALLVSLFASTPPQRRCLSVCFVRDIVERVQASLSWSRRVTI